MSAEPLCDFRQVGEGDIWCCARCGRPVRVGGNKPEPLSYFCALTFPEWNRDTIEDANKWRSHCADLEAAGVQVLGEDGETWKELDE